jgi:hypothetical protein
MGRGFIAKVYQTSDMDGSSLPKGGNR